MQKDIKQLLLCATGLAMLAVTGRAIAGCTGPLELILFVAACCVFAVYGRETAGRSIRMLLNRRLGAGTPVVLACCLALLSGALQLAGLAVTNQAIAAPVLLLCHLGARSFVSAWTPDLDAQSRPLAWLVGAAVGGAAMAVALWLLIPMFVRGAALSELPHGPWGAVASVDRALGAGIAVLAVASPLSLLLAARAPFEEAVRVALSRSIRVTDSNVIIDLREVRIVAFDRWGTITEDRCHVEEVVPLGDFGRIEVLETAHALASQLPPSWGNAIKARCAQDAIEPLGIEEKASVPGLGAWGCSGHVTVSAGLPRLMREMNIDIQPAVDVVSRCRARARTAVLAARDGALTGVLVLKDPLKRDSVRAVRVLAAKGVRPALITPETREDVAVLAEQAGISLVVGDVLPGACANALEQLRSETIGRVLFVSAQEAAKELAASGELTAIIADDTASPAGGIPVVISRNDVGAIPLLLRISNEAFIKMVQNYALAIVYHAVVFPLAALGCLHPLPAGLFSLVICVLIGVNTSRLSRKAV